MDRRRFLGVLLTGSVVGTAGCSSGRRRDDSEKPLARRGSPSDICERGIRPFTAIDSIDEPSFAPNWSGASVGRQYSTSGRLDDGDRVVGLSRGSQARAYPLSVLAEHEIVNDQFGGPVTVTYCPLCRSALVASRIVAGEPTTFHVSGRLWTPPDGPDAAAVAAARAGSDEGLAFDANLVMYDEATKSYWSQLLARAICGPRRGRSLELLPASVTTWERWQRSNPGTTVLAPPSE